ncbi:hypothetical protein T01_1912 [Trichinella spiralis]|uniref:Uncharacterized protein n=1 Tax=Trichinella spiralis TaxID=6334 RepID=A0A0V1BDY4_TRISP|nr:hypothetical protein T01_8682 [Trichinella spiralis]KRY35129.1 hypothetical protein T01_1912 [Trichinella spiralis]
MRSSMQTETPLVAPWTCRSAKRSPVDLILITFSCFASTLTISPLDMMSKSNNYCQFFQSFWFKQYDLTKGVRTHGQDVIACTDSWSSITIVGFTCNVNRDFPGSTATAPLRPEVMKPIAFDCTLSVHGDCSVQDSKLKVLGVISTSSALSLSGGSSTVLSRIGGGGSLQMTVHYYGHNIIAYIHDCFQLNHKKENINSLNKEE